MEGTEKAIEEEPEGDGIKRRKIGVNEGEAEKGRGNQQSAKEGRSGVGCLDGMKRERIQKEKDGGKRR